MGAPQTVAKTQGSPLTKMNAVPLVIIVLIALAVIGTGLGYYETSKGGTNFACMNVTHSGNQVQVTSGGLLHYVGSQYYISCGEGSSLPTSFFSSSCLTITPHVQPATIGVGASTEYYYLASTNGSPVTLQGTAPLANGGEVINMNGVSLSVSC